MPWNCFACLKPESTDIKVLNYEHCTLNDVPAEVFAFERTLEELYLDSNRIRDLPRPLFHCHGLKVLSMSDNEVHSLPPAIASLINLHHLDVSRNALNSIPDNLKGCKHLTYVDVSVNPLEKLPEGFTQLISLEELYLNDTYLDFLPANFGRLMRLRILELRENNLNTLPKSIARLAHLQRLDIGQNDFSDVPEVIGNLPNLIELWIDSNRIRCIPPLIGNLKKLVHLEASNNNIRSVASEIEHCAKLLDFTLTCNELSVLPHTIGNLKELVTLKVDDNQLSALPNSIGKFSNLEELILSQNDLQSLPASIGLLRKLHILNVDDNMLEELPPEIGSCTSLTILSAHSNKLQHVPGELGHLSNLRVINLSENHLQNLPVSVLNLIQLTALWLSNNQSTPLTTLQQELDKQSGQMVCTNFMLPQSTQETTVHEGPRVRREICDDERPAKIKPHITFATDADIEAPSRLLRAPTPYPKELRAMAKHARAMHHFKKSSKESEDDIPVIEEMVSQEPKDVMIKEAKVKKPSTDTVGLQTLVQPIAEKNVDVCENEMEFKSYLESNKMLQDYSDTAYSNTLGEVSAIVSVDSGPVVREAKCVRKINTSSTPSMPSPGLDTRQRQSIASNSEQSYQQPPPYHIAAAYSKQAMFFMQNNSQCSGATSLPNMSEARTRISSVEAKEREEQKDQRRDLDLAQNQIPKNEEAPLKTISELVANEECRIQMENKGEINCAANSCDEEIKISEENDSVGENISDEVTFVSPDHVDASHKLLYNGDKPLSVNKFSQEKKEDGLDIKSSDEEKCVKPVRRDINDISDNCKGQVMEVHQNGTESVTSNMSSRGEFEHTGEEGGEVLLMQKPQTFTQDKPVVREGVVAPTPQRPRSASFGGPNPQSEDKSDLSLSLPVATSPTRKISGIPKATRVPAFVPVPDQSHIADSSVVIKPNSISKESQSHICESDLQTPSKNEIWHPYISPPFTRIPVPRFYSSQNQNHSSNTNNPTSGLLNRDDALNSLSNNISTVNEDYVNSSPSVSLTDSNFNRQYTSLSQMAMEPNNIRNNSYREESSFVSDHNSGASKIPTLGPYSEVTSPRSMRSPPGHQSRIPAPVNLSKSFAENQIKSPSKVWMFGPHKNATVFPVTIQKNSGLGFSISGGVKAPVNSERYENEIYVTKVHPNGPASGLIMPGDKILEVDGVDFTKLEHDQAVNILKQTGNIVNMMISRQQT